MSAISNTTISRLLTIGFIIIIMITGAELLTPKSELAENIPLQTQFIAHSDYSMNDFTLTIMDKNGYPSRVITGEQMVHYPEGDRIEITMPTAQIIDQQQMWQLSAKQGSTSGKGETLLLTEDVIVDRTTGGVMTLNTEKLTLNSSHNTAYTDAPVMITTIAGKTYSTGLHATLDQKLINLHSQVKSYYETSPSD